MQVSADTLYRQLPQMGELLARPLFAELMERYGRELVTSVARERVAWLREQVRAGAFSQGSLEHAVEELPTSVARALQVRTRPSLRRVINATGVILQTNLGRAPLSAEAISRVAEVACGYSNLEFDLESGERSRRDVHADELIVDVLRQRGGKPLDGRAAAVVNNCAAATLLALNTMAEGGEVIVSRGELVEIGGGFRVPDILRKSGATLREVGTTNRTRVDDYANAITAETRLILRVHRSNFAMQGFVAQPALGELVELGERAGVPVFEDQGTGAIVDLQELGVEDESSWMASAGTGVALIACSGDKLLGGPQCGILVGAQQHIERLRANPLFRALRVDKMTYAALEATLQAYLQGREAELPAIAAMRATAKRIRDRCESLAASLTEAPVVVDVVEVRSVIGGGTTPGATLASYAVALRPREVSDDALARTLRMLDTPVIPRTQDGRVLLDLRTVPPQLDAELTRLLLAALAP